MSKKLEDKIRGHTTATLKSFTRGDELEELDKLHDRIRELEKKSILDIPLEEVEVGKRIRKDLGDIDDLVNSIEANGLINPITVAETKKGYKIIAGGRRYESYRILQERSKKKSFNSIPAIVLNDSVLDTFDLEITENIARKNFNDMEFAEALAERKVMYEALHPETKHGGKRQVSQSAISKKAERFTLDTARKLGCGETKIKEYLRLNRLDDDLKDMVRKNEITKNEAVKRQSERDLDKENRDKDGTKRIVKIKKTWGYYSINSSEKNIRISVKDREVQEQIQQFLENLEMQK